MSLLNTLLGTGSSPSRSASKLDERAETKRVRKLVMESSGYLTLNPKEVASLKAMLSEGSYNGVFMKGSFTTDDASALGLDFDPNDEGSPGGSGDERHQLQNRSQAEYDAGMLPAHLALVAPDLTPGNSSPVSTSEAQRVIGPQEPPAPAPAAPQHQQTVPPPAQPATTAEARARAMIDFGGLNVPQSLHEGEESQSFTPAATGGDVTVMAANLAEARRRRNEQSKSKRRSGGGGSSPTEEGRRIAGLTTSKLSQL